MDNGTIRSANKAVRSGCNIELKNNSVIEKNTNDELIIDVGATFNITNGEIIQVN